MATLQNCFSGDPCLLRARHVFGRDGARCDTLLDSPYASRLHAQICWHGTHWALDAYGQNGAAIGGVRLSAGQSQALHCGDLIEFARGMPAWRVADLAAPADTLWPLCPGAAPIILCGRHPLPASASGGAEICRDAGAHWVLRSSQGDRLLGDGDEVVWGELAWRLHLAPRDVTLALARPGLERIDFLISLDEEHVQVRLHTATQSIDLGERAHHYCLATLARTRFAAQQSGCDRSAQGWVELVVLERMLGLPALHINVQIHRARRQLAGLKLDDAVTLLERRRGAVRFGDVPFRVFRGDTLECLYLPNAGGVCAR